MFRVLKATHTNTDPSFLLKFDETKMKCFHLFALLVRFLEFFSCFARLFQVFLFFCLSLSVPAESS